MTKHRTAVVVATCLWTPQAAGQSILQKTDWQSTKFETYLPDPGPSVPWLNLESRTKLPKNDMPLGRYAEGIGRLVLQPTGSNIQISSNEHSARRMP
jgi:hypothetical protein